MRKVRTGIHFLLIFIFVALGFIGLALPIIPQTIFFAIAFIILTFEFPKLGDWFESKFRQDSKILKIYKIHRQKFEKYFK